MGDLRAGRHRSRTAAWHRRRGVRRRHRPGLRTAPPRSRRRPRRSPADRQHHERRLGPPRVHLRAAGPGRHGGHRVLVLAGRAAPRGPGPATGGVRTRAGRRRHRDADSRHVPGVQPSAGARAGRPLQAVRAGRRRHRLVGGRGPASGGAAVRRPPQRPPRPRGRARLGGEPGRCQQRADRPQRPRAGTRRPAGAGGGRVRARGDRRDGGPRHRHPAGGPDRGAGVDLGVRAGAGRRTAVVVGVVEVEHRACAGGRRCRRGHQDGRGDAARGGAGDAARGRAVASCGLVGGFGRAGDGCGGVAGAGASAAGGRLLVRDQRDQRPRHPRTGTGSLPPRGREPGTGRPAPCCRAAGPVGAHAGGVEGPGRPARRVPGGPPERGPGRDGRRADDGTRPPGAPGRRRRGRPGPCPFRPHRPGLRRGLRRPAARSCRGSGAVGVRVHRAGESVRGNGA